MKVDFLPIFRERRRLPSRRPDVAPGKILRPTSSRGGKKKDRPSIPERAASLKRCKCRTGYERRGGGEKEKEREGEGKARADRKWPPLTRRDQKLVSPDTRKRRREMREAEKKRKREKKERERERENTSTTVLLPTALSSVNNG